MARAVKIGAIHLAVEYGEPEVNRKNILDLAHKAADLGCKIIVSPEMGLTGYRFHDRKAIARIVEPDDGPIASSFKDFAKDRQVYFITAFAERDRATGMFYNAVFAFGPEGTLLCKYRKINAESRWACPGPPGQNNVFDSPWGKIGLLICSDSYHSLPSRVSALKGAQLLVLPANWPPSNNFPANIWRMRALENGLWYLACNRTGAEEKFKCQESISHLINPMGEELVAHKSEDSSLMLAEIPLDDKGQFAFGNLREEILARRKPWTYHRIYANLLFFRNITDTLELPKATAIDAQFLVPGKWVPPVEFLEDRLDTFFVENLVVLPLYPYSQDDLMRLEKISKERKLYLICASEEDGVRTHYLMDRGQELKKVPLSQDCFNDPAILGPLVIYFTKASELIHPEPVLCAAKKGADLALALEESFGPNDRFIATLRPIEQLAVGICAHDGAALGLIPEGHVTGRGAYAKGGSSFTYTLDTRILRDKHFLDRVDFEEILKGGGREEDYL
ncbi:MAG: carbon-nitrogen hydrolase family protein [Deltaproteobacteria bacterium]|jgi:predicted amidohydrolase|nr:carbon-nitrogen hydrolase family protein [Deltaproteobacteria bacterium]